MFDNVFPKYLVLKCLNQEEFAAVTKLSTALPLAQVKVSTDLKELANDILFTDVFTSQPQIEDVQRPDMSSGILMDESVQHEDEITGPGVKKVKVSFEVFQYLTDEAKPHDKILLVEDTKFYIQSDKLIKNSNYFRSMFTSNYKETVQEDISIKVFDSEKMKLFLDALFWPKDFDITEDNLEMIMELFGFFEAVNYLIRIFKENNVFENVDADKILYLSNRFTLNELKNAMEEFLIDQMNRTYANLPVRPYIDDQVICFEDPAESCLELSEKYQLNKLLDVTDFHLASEFTKNVKPFKSNLPYTPLPYIYPLPKLTKAIETYALKKAGIIPVCVINKYISKHLKSEVKMTELKKKVGRIVLKEFDRNPPTSIKAIQIYAEHNQKCDSVVLMERISNSLEFILGGENLYNTMQHRDARKLAFKYEIEPLKSRLEDEMIAEFKKTYEYPNTYAALSQFNLPRLKESVENYHMNVFNKSEKDDELFRRLSYYCKDCQMERLTHVHEIHPIYPAVHGKPLTNPLSSHHDLILTCHLSKAIQMGTTRKTGAESLLLPDFSASAR